MIRTVITVVALSLAMSFGAYALTVSGDSATGALETVQPTLNSVTAVSESSLEVTFSEPMLEPGVTTLGNYAVFGLGAGTLTAHPTAVTGSEPYALTWASGEMYATSVTVIATGLQDAVGNPIDPARNRASGMGIGAPVPLYAWPLALALLLAGLLVLVRRRNRAGALLLLVLAALIAAPAAFAQTTTVTNVAFTQGPYTGGTQVDISYDLGGSASCAISVLLSKDGGATFPTTLPLAHLSGDVGPGVTPGTKHIVWNIAADCPNEDMPYARIRVTADDGGVGEITIFLPDSVPLVLVRIPAGTFQMGSPDTERNRTLAEGPVHTVNIGYDFYLGKYELTQAQWLAVMGSWPGTAPDSIYGVGANYPAYYLSWDDARNFVTALNAHIAATSQGAATMRLPSEAEWEYACRAGTQTRFYFGDSLGVDDDCEDDGTRRLYMWYCGNSGVYGHPGYGSQPVGGRLANAFGLHDMSGNIHEWCEDDWHVQGGYTSAPTNGSAWVDSPRASARVMRGGGWSNSAMYCRSAMRNGITTPSNGGTGNGFRVAAVR